MMHPIALLKEIGQFDHGGLGKEARLINQSELSYEFNTGVAVLNLDKWRNTSITEDCEHYTDLVNARGGEQVGLNLALFGRIDVIKDWRWNVRGFNVRRPPARCMHEAKILHWSGKPGKVVKPWNISTDPEERYRWRYDLIEPYVMQPRCRLE